MSKVTGHLESLRKINEQRYPTKVVNEEVFEIMNYFEQRTGKRAVSWPDLGNAWKTLFKVNIEDFGITDNGASLKTKLQAKVLKYKDKVDGLTKRILSRYPAKAFNDEDVFYQEAIIALTESFRNAMISPSMWKHADNGQGDITIGPAFLKNFGRTLTVGGPGDAADGYILTAVKSAVYKEMRTRDALSPHFRKIVKSITTYVSKVELTEKRTPSESDIAKEIGVDVKMVKQYLALVNLSDTSYDDAQFYNAGGDFGKKIKSGQGADPSIFDKFSSPEIMTLLSDELQKSWKLIDQHVPQDQKVVLELFIFEELSLHEISKILGTTEKEIQELFVDAVETMKTKVKLKLNI